VPLYHHSLAKSNAAGARPILVIWYIGCTIHHTRLLLLAVRHRILKKQADCTQPLWYTHKSKKRAAWSLFSSSVATVQSLMTVRRFATYLRTKTWSSIRM